MYRSQSLAQHNTEKLCKLIEEMSQKHKNGQLVLMGDFNLKNIKWSDLGLGTATSESNKEEIMLINTLSNNYLVQLVQNPTRGRGKDKPSLIDLVITNDDKAVSDLANSSPIGNNDHCVISFHGA